MGRRTLKASGGGVSFVSNSIGSLVTLKSPHWHQAADFNKPQKGESLGSRDLLLTDEHVEVRGSDGGVKQRADVKKLESLWDRHEKLVIENQRRMQDLQSLPAPSHPEEVVEIKSTTTVLKEVLPAPLPVVLDAWDQRPSFLKFGDTVGSSDSSIGESMANVATSAPFLYIGLNTPRKKPYDRLYARSLMAVGVASSMYHTSRGATRPFFRWCDYAMIGASSMCLTKALNPDVATRWLLLSATLLPFQPMLVTALNAGAMEVKFARRSFAEPKRYQRAHRLHAASTLLGGVFFLAEEVYPDFPFVHAAWHAAAALAVHTTNALLE